MDAVLAKRQEQLIGVPELRTRRFDLGEPPITGVFITNSRPVPPVVSRVRGRLAGSGRMLPFQLDAWFLDRRGLPISTEYERLSSCGNCKGISGGCPGASPRFEQLRPSAGKVLVLAVSVDYAHSFAHLNSGYGQVLMAMSIIDRSSMYIAVNIVNAVRGAHDYALYCGGCKGCKHKPCPVTQGEKCAQPLRRSYSLESVGVDCDLLHAMLYGEALPWYFQGTGLLPTYMTRYVALLTNRTEEELAALLHGVLDEQFYSVNSVWAAERVGGRVLMRIPRGSRAGQTQWAYLRLTNSRSAEYLVNADIHRG